MSGARGKAIQLAAMRQAVIARRERDIESVVRVALAAGLRGVSSVDIADKLGRSYDTVIKWIGAAVKAGRIEMAGHARSAVYGPPGTRAEWARQRLINRREQNTQRAKERRDEKSERYHSAPFVHLIIPAGSKPPPVTRAPRSVFEFAS
jgi:transposase